MAEVARASLKAGCSRDNADGAAASSDADLRRPSGQRDAAVPKRRLAMIGSTDNFALEQQERIGKWWLVYLPLKLRVELPTKSEGDWWEIIGDDDSGAAFAVYVTEDGRDDEDPKWCCDFFPAVLYTEEGRGEFVVANGSVSCPIARDDYERTREMVTFGTTLGACLTKVFFEAAHFPGNGSVDALWVRAESVVEACQLAETFTRSTNQFVHEHIGTWERFFQQIGFGLNSVRRSQAYGTDPGQVTDAWRVLPWVSIPLRAVFALLCRLAFRHRSSGGLKSERGRLACKELLSSLILRCLGEPMEIEIYMCPIYQWDPPLLPVGQHKVLLRVECDGKVSLGDLQRVRDWIVNHLLDANHDTKKMAWSISSDLDGELPALALFEEVASKPLLASLLGQLALAFAQRLECTLLSELKSKRTGEPGIAMHLTTAENLSASEMQKELCVYQLAGLKECEISGRLLSVASDGARLGLSKKLLGLTVLPNNVAVWWPPQVQREVRYGMVDAKQVGDQERFEEAKSAHMKRSLEFLEAAKGGKPVEKSKKVYRKASLEWLLSMENGIRQSTFPGFTWEFYMMDESIAERPRDALSWPRLSLASDCGGDVSCAVNALLRRWRANIDFYPDDSHGVKNDMKAVLRESGLWRWCLVMLSALNAPHSPWWENARFQQIREGALEALKSMDMQEDCLFSALLPGILRDGHDEAKAAEEGVEGAMWSELQNAGCFRNLGRRVSLMRFMDFPMRLAEIDPEWHMRLYGMLTSMLMSGDLDTGAAQQFSVKMRKAMENTTEEGERKTMRQGDSELQVAKQHATNQLHLACIMFADDTNQKISRCVVVASKAACDWWAEAARENRSVGDSKQWLIKQVTGGFWVWANSLAEVLDDGHNLDYIGFARRPNGTAQEVNVQVTEEDSMAQRFADLVMLWLGCRVKRLLHMLRGWPTRFVALLGSSPQREAVISEFRDDFERYQRVKQSKSSKVVKTFSSRSLFEIVPVQQYLVALQQRQWQVDERLLAWEDERSSRVIASLVIEDGVHHCKGAASQAANKRVGDLKIYHTLVHKKVAESVHHYESPVKDGVVVAPRCATLPEDSFHAPAARATSQLSKLASEKQSVPWWSPGANDSGVPIMDLMLAKYLEAKGDLTAIGRVDLIVMVRGQRNMVVRDKTGNCGGGQWLMPLVLVHTMGALAWPVEMHPKDGPNGKMRFTLKQCREVQSIFIVDAADWEAMVFQWWSPLHCYQNKVKPTASGALQAIVTRGPIPLTKAVAETCFGLLPKTTLLRLCDLLELQGDRNLSLLELLHSMVGEVCELEDDEAIMAILQLRAQPRECADMLQRLLSEDHVLDNCDRDERSAMETEVKSLATDEKARAAFKDEWVKKKKVVMDKKRAAAADGKKGGKKATTGSGAKVSYKGPAEWKGDEPALQKQAKSFLPPGAYVWRANTTHRWCAELKKRGQVSASWLLHGPQEALRIVLAAVWDQFLEEQGLDRASCPIKNLYAEGVDVMSEPAPKSTSKGGSSSAAGPSSAASSSSGSK